MLDITEYNPIINTFSAHSLIKSEGAAAAGSQHAERGLGWKMGGSR